MSDTIVANADPFPVRASLWREGLRLFRANWGEWAKYAVWFFAIMAVLQALIYDPSAQAEIQKITAHAGGKSGMTPEEKAMLMNIIMRVVVVGVIPVIIISIVQTFVYAVFFLKQLNPLIGKPEMSIGRFFYWIWKYIQMVLLIYAAALVLIGIPVGIGFALMNVKPVLITGAAILGVVGFGFFIFISFRLVLVSTLAVCAVPAVFKTSWKLMKGNCWRLFGNMFLFMLVVMVFWLVAAIAEKAISEVLLLAMQSIFPHQVSVPKATQPLLMRLLVPEADPESQPFVQYLQIVFETLNLCVLTGLLRAFYCASARVFYQENPTALVMVAAAQPDPAAG